MPQDQRLKTILWIGAQRIERCPVRRVTEIVRKLDDLRHTAKVFLQHDVPTAKANFRVAVQATLRRKGVVVRDPVEIAALQVGNCVVRYPDTVRADLLIIADYHHFLRDIE